MRVFLSILESIVSFMGRVCLCLGFVLMLSAQGLAMKADDHMADRAPETVINETQTQSTLDQGQEEQSIAATATPQAIEPPTLPIYGIGSEDAPVKMVEFSSLTCGHCAHFHADKLKDLKQKYVLDGTLRIEFIDFPLDGVALRGHLLAHCMGESGYVGLLDLLYQKQGSWARSSDPIDAMKRIASFAGLTEAEMNACINDTDLVDALLTRRLEMTDKYKINSTPTFVLNDGAKIINGNRPIEDFEKAIEDLADGAKK